MYKNLPLSANGSLEMCRNDATTLVQASKINLQLLFAQPAMKKLMFAK